MNFNQWGKCKTHYHIMLHLFFLLLCSCKYKYLYVNIALNSNSSAVLLCPSWARLHHHRPLNIFHKYSSAGLAGPVDAVGTWRQESILRQHLSTPNSLPPTPTPCTHFTFELCAGSRSRINVFVHIDFPSFHHRLPGRGRLMNKHFTYLWDETLIDPSGALGYITTPPAGAATGGKPKAIKQGA